MKSWIMIICVVTVAAISSVLHGSPVGYGAGESSGGAGGYGGSSGRGFGGGGHGGQYQGSYASDALKNSYNNFDGYYFDFGYNIEDPYHNNFQSRYESGSADPKGEVTGSYFLLEPDGSKRTVNYVADDVNGFRAIVEDKNGITSHGYNMGGGDSSYGGGHYGSGGYGGGKGNYASSGKY